MKSREQFQQAFCKERARELQDEVARMEIAQIKARARNAALRQNLNAIIEQDDLGAKRIAEQTEKL